MASGINESKTLTKHISCKFEYKFDGRKRNSTQKWNIGKCWCECKTPEKTSCLCQKSYFWNPATCSCENGKYAGSITDNSVITCDEIIDTTKKVPTNFNKKD